ncbi:UNVERIFIED_ORG: autotransporter domain-containing protein (plasmid) [Roseateles sp. XES5]|nr:autotransporter domain-containing protein [Roseateles sp. XES5]
MKARQSKPAVSSLSRRKTRLLSATALAAAGALLAQAAGAADYEYTTPGPHTDAVVVGAGGSRIYATPAAGTATFAGTVTFQTGNNNSLHLGLDNGSNGTLVFAPTAMTNQTADRVFVEMRRGTLRLGSAVARSFIANSANFYLSGGTLDLAGADLTLGRVSGFSGSTVGNYTTGTDATLIFSAATGETGFQSRIVNGNGSVGLRVESGASVLLTEFNTYGGGTVLAGGSVRVSNSQALGVGTVRVDGLGSSIAFGSGASLDNSVVMHDATLSLDVESGRTATMSGPISGTGDVFKVGAGELVFRGEHVADGRIFLNAGTLTSDASGGDGLSDAASIIIDRRGTFRVLGHETVKEVIGQGVVRIEDSDSELTVIGDADTGYGGVITGGGSFRKEGAGVLTLRSRNTYEDGTTIAQGTLVAAASGALGTGRVRFGDETMLVLRDGVRLDNDVELTWDDANIEVRDGETGTLGGRFYEMSPAGGDLGLNKHGGGTLVLAGTGTIMDHADVEAGTLQVDGRIRSPVTVFADATLTGSGTVEGDVTIQSGGMLAGRSGSKLTMTGSLTLNNSSYIDARLGAASTDALFDVGGNLILDGRLSIADAGGFGRGVYRLFDYGGSLTDNGLDIIGVPGSTPFSDISLQTAIARQVNIVVAGEDPDPGPVPDIQFWDGGGTTADGRIGGGAGTWGPATTNWTRANGEVNDAWSDRFAVFQGAAGTVTVAGTLAVTGMQFETNGYRLEGGAITLGGAGGETILRVGNGAASGASTTATIGSSLGGAGRLVKTDHGNLILEGANDYTGGTEIRTGTLQVSRDANLGAAAGGLTMNGGRLATTASFDTARTVTLVQAGTFDVAAGTTLGLTGAVSGGADLVKTGAGLLRLDNASNAYGDTLVRAGTLVGHAGSMSGTVGNAGTVVFDQAADGRFAGDIVGLDGTRGSMAKRGAGTLALAGRSSLDWSVEAGGLATAAERFGGNAAIASGASLDFDQQADAVYAGVLSGAGRFGKTGTGRLELTGSSAAFTGTTSVLGGTLAVNGRLGGHLDLAAAARLQGTGTIGDTVVNGTIAPGNSIGTLTVAGNISFAAGSVFEVEADTAGQADKILASGGATIAGGTVRVLAGTGDYGARTRYTILTADGGRTGTFTGVTSNLAFLDPTLGYDANNVYLTLARNGVDFASIGRTANQIATGRGAESLGAGNAVYDAVLGLATDDARAAFDQLSGEIHASARTAMLDDSRFLRNAVNDHLRGTLDSGVALDENGVPTPSADGLSLWSQGFGSWGHVGGDGNAARLDRSTGGFFVGADAPVFDTWRFGAVAGYGHSSFSVKDRQSSGSSDDYHVGVYGGATWGDVALRTGAAYTWHDVSTSRTVSFTGFSDGLKGDYDAGTAQVFSELGYRMEVGGLAFEPFANLAYVSLHTDGFTERGGAAALVTRDETTDMAFSTFGLRASTAFDLAGAAVTARGMVGWRHAFGDETPSSSMRFASGGNAFAISGVPITRDAAVVEAGLDMTLTPSATLGITYSGQFGSGAVDQSFKGTLNVKF